MRRVLTMMVLLLALGGVAGSAGAFRCECCVDSPGPAFDAADLCCPNGDADQCASPASGTSAAPTSTAAEVSRPAVLPEIASSASAYWVMLELRAAAARPSGREGLALRSILRI